MRLAYFYLVLGIVVSLVIVSSYAQVPLVAQSGQNTLSVGKISINYLTNNGYESTPAVPKNWQLSFLPLWWFYSAPSITVQNTLSNTSTSTNFLPNIVPAVGSPLLGDSGGEVIIYDNYVYAFYTSTGSTSGSTSGETLYWTSEPFNDYDYIITKATWTASSYSNIKYLGAATLVGNTVYIGAQMSGDAYIIAATLGSGGTITSWTSYQIATSGAVEAILYANNEWYVAVGNGPAVLYYGSSLSSLTAYAPSGYTYGDIVGLVQTANGDIVVGWYEDSSTNNFEGTTVAFAYYNPSSNTWSSVYTISAPSGYYTNDWGITALGGKSYAPMYGYQMAASGNTVVFDLIWDSENPDIENSMSSYTYMLNTYSYQIGSSSVTLISSSNGNDVDNVALYPWLVMYSVGNDIYVAFGGTQVTSNYDWDIQTISVSQNAGVTWKTLYSWSSSSISNDEIEVPYGSAEVNFYPDPQYAFYNGSLLVFTVGDIPYENPSAGTSTTNEFPLFGIIMLNAPEALSSYQISLSNIVPSGSFVEAYPGAPLNTVNLTVTVYQGLNMSSLTQGASQTWADIPVGSSLSWTTPWLQLQTPNLYPITITNSQSSATQAPFQQMIYIPNSTASSFGIDIDSNAQNVMFLSGGSPLYSWFEGNNGTGYIWWVKLPNGIPASSSIQIQMNVTPGANDYATYYPYVGEAPQLSSTYGQYDNGQYVFNFYDNFAGTTLSSNWINNGMSVTVNNGVTLTPSGSAGTWSRDSITYNTNVYGTNYVAESYTKITALGSDINPIMILNSNSNTAYSGSYDFVEGGIDLSSTSPSYYHDTQTSSGSITSTSISMPSGYSYSAFNVYQIYVKGASIGVAVDYSGILNTQTSYNPSTQYLGIGSWAGAYTPTTVTLWFRTRAYPPNGVMPSITLPINASYTSYYVVQFTVNALNAFTKQPMSYIANVTLTNNLYWDTALDVFDGSNFYITGGSMTPVLVLPFQAIMLLALLWIAIIYLIRRDIRMSELD